MDPYDIIPPDELQEARTRAPTSSRTCLPDDRGCVRPSSSASNRASPALSGRPHRVWVRALRSGADRDGAVARDTMVKEDGE